MKRVYLLGGLGNQLWLAAYSHYLLQHGFHVCLDSSWYSNFSSFFFNTSRVSRASFSDFILHILPSLDHRSSVLSLVRLRIKLLFITIFNPSLVSLLIYRQSSNYISDDFINKLIYGLNTFAPLSHNECNKLRSMTGLHLRLGDRGTTLTNSESVTLKSILNTLDPVEPLLVFTDNELHARSLLSQIQHSSILVFADYIDDLTTLHALSLCKERLCIRPSTFFHWAEILSRSV